MVFSNITNTATQQQSSLAKIAGALKLKPTKRTRPRIVVQLPHIVAATSTPIPPTTKSKSKTKTKTKTKKSSASRPHIVVQLPHIVGHTPTPPMPSPASVEPQWQPPKRYGDILVDGILSPKEYLAQCGHYDEAGSWRMGKYASSPSSTSSSYSDSDDDYIPYIPRPVGPSQAKLESKRRMKEFSREMVAKGKAFFDENGDIQFYRLGRRL